MYGRSSRSYLARCPKYIRHKIAIFLIVIAGESERAGRTWYWRSEIQETPVPGFMRLTVTVTSEEDEGDAALYTLDAFLNADGSNASR